MIKVGITAASGHLGRAIVLKAVQKIGKQNVVGIVRTPEKALDLGVEIRKGDYNNLEDFQSAFQGIDVVLVISGMDHPDKRIQQHRNVIRGAKAAGVRKIIYTSIYGIEGKCYFDAIIQSNRQTEIDVRESGLEWVIGRNGLYIDADMESIDVYKKKGKIANSGGDGRCAYTSREELASAYINLIIDDSLNNQVYNLCGDPVTQQQLTDVINDIYGLNLSYQSISVADYLEDRIATHGDFLGNIIAGIYQGIREGAFDIPSDYKKASGRKHLSLEQMVQNFKDKQVDTISTIELQKSLSAPEFKLIDIRPVEAYNGWKLREEQRGGHISGARSLPFKWLDYIDWIEIVRSKGILPQDQLVVYGYDQEKINRVVRQCKRAGYIRVRAYYHFLDEWSNDPALSMDHLQRYRQLVSAEWLKKLIDTGAADEYDNNKYVICHVHYRNKGAYDEGHIPGAIEVDTNSLESPETWNRRSPEELKEVLESLGIAHDTTVILYGRFSFPNNDDLFPGSSAGHLGAIRCAFIMMYAGVKDVRILNGGLQSWSDAGYEITTEETSKTGITEFGAPVPSHPELAVDIDEAKEILKSPDKNLVSVRSWREFIGEVSGYNYIEKKGRIPGAVFGNCGSDAYHMENYRNLDHTTREYHEIESQLAEVGVTSDKINVFYCGTGWRGSEAWINTWLMGWPTVAVFDGGWFEWSSDSGNPYETGIPENS